MKDTLAHVIGIDFGTDSVRAVVVDANTGFEAGTSEVFYPRWSKGMYCNPSKLQFRQHPLDYIESMEICVNEALSKCKDIARDSIKGIGIDTTGSTICAVDAQGVPLVLKKEFEDNPNAMFVLWKDHTANNEAMEINNLAHSGTHPDYTQYEGGIYSSEWFWSKILHIYRTDTTVREAAFSWIEHCDWIPALLTGNTEPKSLKRSRCAAGHKAMWHPDWGGLPDERFLLALEPSLAKLKSNLYTHTYPAVEPEGRLSAAWQKKFNLSADVVVSVGAFDAHIGAVGAGIEPFYLTKVIGTSTCDMLVAHRDQLGGKRVKGICGQVEDSIIPGLVGLEAGQSAYGDYYAWFRSVLLWPLEQLGESPEAIEKAKNKLIPLLSDHASNLPLSGSDPIAMDWINGRRTPDANHRLKAAISGLDLGITPPHIFKAIVEATAFGSKSIVERFTNEGVPIKGVIALGGVAKKSKFAMQTLSDVLQMPIKIVRSEHACALGAAMFASVASGVHSSVEAAQRAMGSGFERIHTPNVNKASAYNQLYHRYRLLGEFMETNINQNI